MGERKRGARKEKGWEKKSVLSGSRTGFNKKGQQTDKGEMERGGGDGGKK